MYLRHRQVQKVFAGNDLVFALGEDVQTQDAQMAGSLMSPKESKVINHCSSSYRLQKIPERDERSSAKITNQNMPMLNLSKLHKSSNQSLKKINEIPRRNKTQSKTPSRSHSAAKSNKKQSRIGGGTRSVSQKRSQRNTSSANNKRLRSDSRESKTKESTQKFQQSKYFRTSAQLASKSQSRSSLKNHHERHARSRSGDGGIGKPTLPKKLKAPSQTQTFDGRNNLCDRSKPSTTKSQKSKKINYQQRIAGKFKQQVSMKFKDLGKQLESDKEELANRLAKLTQKVAKIHKGKPPARKQSQNINQLSEPGIASSASQTFNPPTLVDGEVIQECASDVMSGGYEFTPDNNANKAQVGLKKHMHQNQSHTVDDDVNRMNMFNQVMRPELAFSAHEDTVVDIFTPPQHHKMAAKHLKVELSNSPRRPSGDDYQIRRQVGHNKNQDLSMYHAQQIPPPSKENEAVFRPENSGSIRSPPPYDSQHQPHKYQSQLSSYTATPNKLEQAHEQALVSQLRDQITFLEKQNTHMLEEKRKEQARSQDFNKRYEDACSQVRQTEMATESQVRSLESQLRTSKIQNQDLTIRLEHADRKLREFEDKTNELASVKRKESNYADKLGKSHETVRLEREKNKDLLNQNLMLQKTLNILETTMSQVTGDKEALEQDNRQLREFSRSLEMDKEAYRQMLEMEQAQYAGDQTQQKSPSKENLSHNDRKDSETHKQHNVIQNTNLARKRVQKSADSKQGPTWQRPPSQLSQQTTDLDSRNLMYKNPTISQQSDNTIVVGIDPCAKKDEKRTQRSLEHFHHKVQDNRDLNATGRFVDPSRIFINAPRYQDHDYADQTHQAQRDPRIHHLLQSSFLLQEQHARLCSASPLRLRQSSENLAEIQNNHGNASNGGQEHQQSLNYNRTTNDRKPASLERSLSPMSVQRPPSHSPLRSNSGQRQGNCGDLNSPLRQNRPTIRASIEDTQQTLGSNPYKSQNQDYVNHPRDCLTNSSLGHVDKKQLRDAYNQHLLGQLEGLAAQKNNQSQEPRLNKFMRSQDVPHSTHDSDRGISPQNVSPLRNSNLSQQQQQSNLPGQLFNEENLATRNGNVYDRLRSTSGAAESSGNKYNKCTLSREDEHSENMMLVDQRPGIAAYADQYSQNGFSESSEKEKQTAHNNSFLARREALQQRLKNI